MPKNHTPGTVRNTTLSKRGNVQLFGKQKVKSLKGVGKFVKKVNPAKKIAKRTSTVKPFGKKGENRTVVRPRLSKWYPTEDEEKKVSLRRKGLSVSQRIPALKKNLVPGSVVIILSGRHAGRRVVFLKQLASGLILVSGPYKVNGVPLRRLDQRFVIVTSTIVDISNVKVPETINDEYFRKVKAFEKSKNKKDAMETSETKIKALPQLVEDQKVVDTQILESMKKVAHLRQYLTGRFSLSNGEYPHLMKF